MHTNASSLFATGLVLLGLYACVVLLAFALQDCLLFVPSSDLIATPADVGMPYEEVTVRTEDDERLHGWWIPASNPNGKTILFFHGNAGNISGRVYFVHHLWDAGYNVFLVDYRGYGKSTGSPSEKGLYRDAQAAWRWLRGERSLSPQDIVLYGRSLGGGPATWLATQTSPAALVLESAFTSVPDIAAHHYSFLPTRLLSRIQFDNEARIADIDVPVLILHGRNDEIVPFSHGQALFDAANEPKRFVPTGESHNSHSAASDRKRIEALRELLGG
ncbi:alpha/beta hydrolase [Longibacter salinarum]|uniref:Alpha/beta hydrolase n=1 Tax=Longibacter salinarum TaxID=1850348 RepID=A0A2A8CV56_9BACT|nr:alpha/beta fold hydrolase [Longibacter salinarum]PEN12331.1 alpha/beta hydrolase [Longibacter salinarum]